MNFEIHHGGNSLNNIANLHVAVAIKNCEYFEVLLPDAANKYAVIETISKSTAPGWSMCRKHPASAEQSTAS